MSPKDALEVLVKAVMIGQSKGAFNLAEAKIIADAVETFSKKEEPAKTEGEKAPLPAKTDEPVQAEVKA